MNEFQLETPIVFIIFNRPDTTAKVFEAIRQAKPLKFLVIADGPREDKPGEAEKCAATRAIIDRVDWDCEVLKNYSDTNLGCGERVSSGLNWVFQNVEEAIILEDDCLPHPCFFQFSAELLEKYRHDERIGMICGTNVLGEWKSNLQSYHFCHYSTIWGWATWRRAWNYYDYKINLWTKSETKAVLNQQIGFKNLFDSRANSLDKIQSNQLNTWDIQWFLARVLNSSLSIVPSLNLVSNIGFSEEATHTRNKADRRANLPVTSITFPLKAPTTLSRDFDYEHLAYKKVEQATTVQRMKWKISKRIKTILQGRF